MNLRFTLEDTSYDMEVTYLHTREENSAAAGYTGRAKRAIGVSRDTFAHTTSRDRFDSRARPTAKEEEALYFREGDHVRTHKGSFLGSSLLLAGEKGPRIARRPR